MKPFSLATFLVILLATMGCVHHQSQALDKRVRPGLKTIALLEVPSQRQLQVTNLGGVGSAFGLIGAAIEESEQERKSTDFSASVDEQRGKLGRHLMHELQRGLEKSGYRVVVLAGVRPARRDEDDQDPDYSGIVTEADAILDVHFVRVGYLAPGSDYLPWMLVGARLVGAKDKSTLYAQHYSYGNASGPMNNVEHMPSPTT